MSLPWTDADRTAVENALAGHPAESNRCEVVAEEVVGIAVRAGWAARRRSVDILEGFVAAKFIHPRRWPNLGWQYHVLAETREHGVDAISGPDGTGVSAVDAALAKVRSLLPEGNPPLIVNHAGVSVRFGLQFGLYSVRAEEFDCLAAKVVERWVRVPAATAA